MHPKFVTLFIETDADDALTEQQDEKRRAHAARRGRSARIVKAAAANVDFHAGGSGQLQANS
jgi:hypothetical protein